MATLRVAKNNYDPGNAAIIAAKSRVAAANAARAGGSRKNANNIPSARKKGADGRSHRESSSGASKAGSYNSKSTSRCLVCLDAFLSYFDDVLPGPEEKYSVIIFIMGGITSILCFLPFYSNAVVFQLGDSSRLQQSLASPQFNVALLLSIIIAVPMLMDVIMDAFYVFNVDSGRKLHWFVRLFLLASLTVPSILLVVPTTFPHSDSTVPGYLCVQALKRLASTASMLAFIAHEKCESKEFKEAQFDPSRMLGQKSALTFATYAGYELFWLYAYTLGAAANQGVSTNNPLRVLGVCFLCLTILQLLSIIFVWAVPYANKGPKPIQYLNKLLVRVLRPGKVVAARGDRAGADSGEQQSQEQMLGRPSFAFATRIMRGISKVREGLVFSMFIFILSLAVGLFAVCCACLLFVRPLQAESANSDPFAERQRADLALDQYLNSKNAHMSSRDISMALFFTAMLLIPAGGLVIAIATGNFAVNSFRANESEISGYVYLQMVFTTLVLILPGWLAR